MGGVAVKYVLEPDLPIVGYALRTWKGFQSGPVILCGELPIVPCSPRIGDALLYETPENALKVWHLLRLGFGGGRVKIVSRVPETGNLVTNGTVMPDVET